MPIRSSVEVRPHPLGVFKFATLLLGLSLLAAACSTTTTTELGGGLASSVSENPRQSVDSDTSEHGPGPADAGSEQAPSGQATDEAGPAGETATGPVAPVPDHLFPDVDVVDIQTGMTFNIATELAGGDRPVLLWFWAPH